MTPEQSAALFLLIAFSIILGMIFTVILFGSYSLFWDAREQHQQAKSEVELDRQSDEVRQTILSLAESLAADKDEMSKAMARALFLTTGRVG